MISYIFAVSENGVLGKDNDMPWHLPNDLKFFKRVTSGHTVIMGRRTYESMGRALPKRRNIILTSDPTFKAEGCEIVHSKEAVLEAIRDENESFVIGGAGLFELFRDDVDKIYKTEIKESFPGDVFFPQWDWNHWKLIEVEDGIIDEKNKHSHQFLIYKRLEK
ncbi:dihydrofolate reductase [Alkalihalobacillus pseudalcaliphilus]|uniref:dihydrofolate reductase n=1 Tax=Alkalihalobacillus pseudalcaliphilus TaxID=79884 RepID=UPI00064DB41D|nr:dihydrofolate reductase [Alkalihalobacillus pseudalcaliphilus]KMK77646.1 dihydrofolate reductase [Alkalihalobacillus pseudalcaliphilus]